MKRLNLEVEDADHAAILRGMSQTGNTSMVAYIRHVVKLSGNIHNYIEKGYHFIVTDPEGNQKEVIFL